MLDEIVVSGTVFADMAHQFPNDIKLVVTREDDLLGFLYIGRAIRHNFLFLCLLIADELLKNIHQIILLQHVLPEVRSHIAVCRIRMVARSAVSACAVATLVEGKKICHGAVKPRGHTNIV